MLLNCQGWFAMFCISKTETMTKLRWPEAISEWTLLSLYCAIFLNIWLRQKCFILWSDIKPRWGKNGRYFRTLVSASTEILFGIQQFIHTVKIFPYLNHSASHGIELPAINCYITLLQTFNKKKTLNNLELYFQVYFTELEGVLWNCVYCQNFVRV